MAPFGEVGRGCLFMDANAQTKLQPSGTAWRKRMPEPCTA